MKCFGIATPAIVTIVQYVEEDRAASLLIAALTIVITIIVAFIATMLIGFEDIVDEDDEDILAEEAKPAAAPLPEGREIRISSPIQGRVHPAGAGEGRYIFTGNPGKRRRCHPGEGRSGSPL